MERIQVDILAISTSSVSGGAYALILKEINGERRLPIIIGAFEAQAIALEIEGIKPPRPMTHDLLKNVIDALGASVIDITISELREGTFYARISLDADVPREIDSRPSDAIALAVRFGVPIYVAEEVFAEAGITPDFEDEMDFEERTARGPEKPSAEMLQQQLREAVEREDYEEAARLRDELRKLQSSG
ncbi:MAG: DUF151 domain-containing protein [Bacteroidota bacterium]|nr:DUF151 domain-containing protein [Bacteroidota bacterium]